MSEFTKSLEDDKAESDDPKGKGTRRVPLPLVSRAPEFARRPPDNVPPLPLLDRLIDKDKSKEDKEKSDDEDEDEPKVADITTEEGAESQPAEAPAVAEAAAAEAAPADVASEEEPPQDDTTVLQIPREPAPEQPELPRLDAEDEDDAPATPPASSAGGGGSTPPPPVTPSPSGPNQGPWFNQAPGNWNTAPAANTNTAPPTAAAPERRRAETEEEERRLMLRRGLVAGFITGWVVHELLVARKQRKQLKEQGRQISGLQKETTELNNRLSTQAEESRRKYEQLAQSQAAEAAKLQAKNQELQQEIFDLQGNRIILQSGQRIERGAGGYSVVLDEHNRVVHEAIRYGEEYQRDQKREQISDDLYAIFTGTSAVNGPQNDGTAGPAAQPAAGQQSSTPPRIGDDYDESAGSDYTLPEERGQVKAAVTSPWLWTGLAVLVIIYFIAALA